MGTESIIVTTCDQGLVNGQPTTLVQLMQDPVNLNDIERLGNAQLVCAPSCVLYDRCHLHTFTRTAMGIDKGSFEVQFAAPCSTKVGVMGEKDQQEGLIPADGTSSLQVRFDESRFNRPQVVVLRSEI